MQRGRSLARSLASRAPGLAALVRPKKGLQGFLDSKSESHMAGWVINWSEITRPIQVGLFVGDQMLADTVASLHRQDLKEAGIGDGKCAFTFDLSIALQKAIREAGGEVVIKTLDQPGYVIGRFKFGPEFDGNLSMSADQISRLKGRMAADLSMLADGLRAAPTIGPVNGDMAQPIHDLLFQPLTSIPDADPAPDAPNDEVLSGYMDFTRYRLKQDRLLKPDQRPGDMAHFMDWYIDYYAKNRGEYRVPLARQSIAYCNAPVHMGGRAHELSRLMWWRALNSPHWRTTMNLDDAGWFEGICYWWAMHEAPSLHIEDCMVPTHVIRTLRTVSIQRRSVNFPLSNFMAHLHAADPHLQDLDLNRETDRVILTLACLLKGVRRPDILRYLPQENLDAVLTPGKDGTPAVFESFARQMLPKDAASLMTTEAYRAVLWAQGYDLKSHSFLTVRADGHRYHAAALPALPEGPPTVDVQMIGPFQKASGLGQATRLSGSIMAETGIDYTCVDFGMDNPAPEGFSTKGDLGGYQRAKVNLIQLNAESIPLAFAYEPDVFNGAYNIGYFFWELDSPALCHYLSLDLLDEVWVSSEYGVEIYQPETNKPVTKVGMCFEELPEVTREEGRQLLASRFRFTDDQFVLLVTFDSYSFVQRKNPVGVLKAFQKAFPDNPDVRLVIKTQNRDNVSDQIQADIWNTCEKIMADDPRIQVLNETLPYSDLIALKKGSDCYISLHKSEGWGFGMIEAMNLGVPVVATNFSGNLEFCNEDTAFLVDYREILLSQGDYIFVREGQKWAEPDVDSAADALRQVYSDPKLRAQKAEAAFEYVQKNFSAKAIAKTYKARLDQILKDRDA